MPVAVQDRESAPNLPTTWVVQGIMQFLQKRVDEARPDPNAAVLGGVVRFGLSRLASVVDIGELVLDVAIFLHLKWTGPSSTRQPYDDMQRLAVTPPADLLRAFEGELRERNVVESQLPAVAKQTLADIRSWLEIVPGHVNRSLQATGIELQRRRKERAVALGQERLRTMLPASLPQLRTGQEFAPAHVTCQRMLGCGGYGEVWEVTDSTGTKYALKLGHGDHTRSSFRREAQILGTLCAQPDHARFVIPLHDGSGASSSPPWLRFEYVKDGRTLSDWISGFGGKIAHMEALLMLVKLLDCVAFAHTNEVVHGDIKPANFLLPEDNLPRMIDFGIGRTESRKAVGSLTAADAFGLTPIYASKERRSFGNKPQKRDDIYALGVIFLQMLLGDSDAEPAPDTDAHLQHQGIPASVRALAIELVTDKRPADASAAKLRITGSRAWRGHGLRVWWARVALGIRALARGVRMRAMRQL